MRTFTAAFAVILLLASAVAAQSKDSALWKDRPFPEARRALLKQGWKPFESTNKNLDGCYANRNGMAGIHYRAGFKEVELCTEGRVYCTFNYTRGKQC